MKTKEQIQEHPLFFDMYEEPGQPDENVFDDEFAHVTRNGVRYTFDTGIASYRSGVKKLRQLARWVDDKPTTKALKLPGEAEE